MSVDLHRKLQSGWHNWKI